jgi:hypothetical protein
VHMHMDMQIIYLNIKSEINAKCALHMDSNVPTLTSSRCGVHLCDICLLYTRPHYMPSVYQISAGTGQSGLGTSPRLHELRFKVGISQDTCYLEPCTPSGQKTEPCCCKPGSDMAAYWVTVTLTSQELPPSTAMVSSTWQKVLPEEP